MTFKASVIWNKVTEVLPEDGKEYLVWDGQRMSLCAAQVYTPEERRHRKDLVETTFANHSEDLKTHLLNNTGMFKEFSQEHHFQDHKIMWAELPLAPGEKNPPLPDPFEGMIAKNAYLKKGDEIVGIHAIGYPGPYEWDVIELDGTKTRKKSDFMQMEIYGNVYDEDHNMLGRGSFRVFNQFEEEVKDWEKDGWVQYEGPTKREK